LFVVESNALFAADLDYNAMRFMRPDR
jgi:hypothetical protein